MFTRRKSATHTVAGMILAALLPAALLPAQTVDEALTRTGERIDPSLFGESYIETIETAAQRGPEFHAHGRGHGQERRGVWMVPSRRSTYMTVGEHAVINKFGDTEMSIGFPEPVYLYGAFVAGQGAGAGVWAKSIQITGYRDGVEVDVSEPYTTLSAKPRWFDVELEGVDRIVIRAVPSHDGAGFYALDNLTFAPIVDGKRKSRVVLDFEDLEYRTKLEGSGYGGLTWEKGGAVFPDPKEEAVHAPIRIPDPDDDHPDVVDDGGLAGGLPGTSPELLDDFQGIIRGDGDSASFPPDTTGAVGPDHFVNCANRAFAVYNKDTGQRLTIMNLGSFLPGSNGDPRVLYDQHSGRWIVIVSDFSNEIYLAVSLTSSAMGSWFKTSFNVSQGADAGCWPDYPTLGVDADGIYMGSFMVGCGMSIFAVDKAPLVDASPSLGTVTAYRGLEFDGAIQPAQTFGDSGGVYIISRDNASNLRLRQITGPLTSPTLNELGFVSIPGHATPPDVPSLGSPTPLDGLDHRLMNALYRDGSLWTTHAIDIDGRAASRWYEIDPVAVTLLQSGTISDDVFHYWMPSIGVNSRGDVILGFSGAHTGVYAACYYAGRAGTDPAGLTSEPMLLRAGAGPQDNIDNFGRNRWGDYSLCSIDPDDDLTMWTIQEYAHSNDIWGNQIAKLAINPAPTNDMCEFAGLIIDQLAVSFNTINAETDGQLEPTECAGDVESDIWYRFFAPCAGDVTFSLSDLDYDARMAVYRSVSCPGAPDEAAACVQAPGETSITLSTQVGEAFRVRIGSAAGAQGAGTLLVECMPGAPCTADCANDDGNVDVVDLLALLGAWGDQSLTCDLAPEPDGDGSVNVLDLLLLLGQWGPCP